MKRTPENGYMTDRQIRQVTHDVYNGMPKKSTFPTRTRRQMEAQVRASETPKPETTERTAPENAKYQGNRKSGKVAVAMLAAGALAGAGYLAASGGEKRTSQTPPQAFMSVINGLHNGKEASVYKGYVSTHSPNAVKNPIVFTVKGHEYWAMPKAMINYSMDDPEFLAAETKIHEISADNQPTPAQLTNVKLDNSGQFVEVNDPNKVIQIGQLLPINPYRDAGLTSSGKLVEGR